jgi:hypothetical protein
MWRRGGCSRGGLRDREADERGLATSGTRASTWILALVHRATEMLVLADYEGLTVSELAVRLDQTLSILRSAPRPVAGRMDRTSAADGSVGSLHRVKLARPVVPFSIAGALDLGRSYWPEVERCTAGIVRRQKQSAGVELCFFGRGPALLRFGEPRLEADSVRAVCCYPIQGGLLARRPGGSISFEQRSGDQLELRSMISGFHPRLAANPGAPHWTGTLYNLQSRIHAAIGRRYFSSLRRRGRR